MFLFKYLSRFPQFGCMRVCLHVKTSSPVDYAATQFTSRYFQVSQVQMHASVHIHSTQAMDSLLRQENASIC